MAECIPQGSLGPTTKNRVVPEPSKVTVPNVLEFTLKKVPPPSIVRDLVMTIEVVNVRAVAAGHCKVMTSFVAALDIAVWSAEVVHVVTTAERAMWASKNARSRPLYIKHGKKKKGQDEMQCMYNGNRTKRRVTV